MAELKSRLYKLALWYIRKCNAEWNKRSYKNELEALDRLTYWNFGKYMLTYGADAEWQIFSRYEVLDNAIQKLAKYEDATTTEAEIRAMAYDRFMKEIEAEYDNDACPNVTDYLDYKISLRDLFRIADELKGGAD